MQTLTEIFPVVDGMPLRLAFCPLAIREHFAGLSDEIGAVADELLLEVGATALQDDALYAAYNRALRDACVELLGFDPERGDE